MVHKIDRERRTYRRLKTGQNNQDKPNSTRNFNSSQMLRKEKE